MRKTGKSKDGKYIVSPPGIEIPENAIKLLDLLPPRNPHTIMPDYSKEEVSRYHVTPFSLNYVTADELNNAYKGIFSENFLRACKEMNEDSIDYNRNPHKTDSVEQKAQVIKGDNMADVTTPPNQEKLNTEIAAENLIKDSVQYTSIEDYGAKTGKRFRMTKELKKLGLTRQQAFEVMYLNKSLADIQKKS